MDLYINSIVIFQAIAIVIAIIIGIIATILAIKVWDEYNHFALNLASIVIAVISFVAVVIIMIIFCFNLGGANIQKQQEEVIYKGYVMEAKTLQASLDNTYDIVNTDLYLAAVSYNKEVTEIRAAYNDPRYSMTFSGDVDWSTVPLVSIY